MWRCNASTLDTRDVTPRRASRCSTTHVTLGAVAGGVRDKTLATFYRGSIFVGVLVGAAFAFSPINPIGNFDVESPATHFARALCGLFILFVLTPAEAVLWRRGR